MNVKVIGIEEFDAALTKIKNMDVIKEIVKVNTGELQNKAQRNAPVDTGNLKRSISLEISSTGLAGRVKTLSEYAPWVERGTRFQSPQPFMAPAVHAQEEKFKRDMSRLDQLI